MQSLLNDIFVGNFFAFLLIFMRFGMALMIMPGIGDSFVTPQVRLLFALSFSLVLTPALSPFLPHIPAGSGPFVMLLLSEALIGVFIGTVMRIMMSALDTAGMTVSMQAGFSNALIFNPVTATQGSLGGALYSMLGVTLLLATDMHHFMLSTVADSYRMFPAAGNMPDAGSLLEVVSRAVSTAFMIGIQLALPFIVVGLLVQIGFGLLGRLMPQVQIFFLALPVQITLALLIMSVVISASILFWLGGFEDTVAQLVKK